MMMMMSLHRKCSALNVDFNGVRRDPLGLRSPPYERVKFGYPLENVRILLLSTNLARERLPIDTDFPMGTLRCFDVDTTSISRRDVVDLEPYVDATVSYRRRRRNVEFTVKY